MSAKKTQRWGNLVRLAVAVVALLIVSGKADIVAQQMLDLCGCADTPDLEPFDARDPTTYPSGTTGCTGPCTSGTINVALPPDGILRFSSFSAIGTFTIRFNQNTANAPVTILVRGDFVLQAPFCCPDFSVSGANGATGTSGIAGVGGAGGNGAFRGGDGSALGINGYDIGGAGFGPGGGAPATPTTVAEGGTYFGIPEMLPLVGGSGGGGGAGFGTAASCTGGGGGGGGGALLVVANGSISITNYQVFADGGTGGAAGSTTCGRGGGGGSGGSIRLVANRISHSGNAQILARGSNGGSGAGAGQAGRIRFETVDTSAHTAFAIVDPPAIRVTGPGPLSNPLSPTVTITEVNGNPVPAVPQGIRGSIDIVLPTPGVTGVNIATNGVPGGTSVLVTAKARLGAATQSVTVPLTNCDMQGQCTATATFDLIAGAYVLEARATFQIAVP